MPCCRQSHLVYYVVTVATISADDGDQISVSYLDINSQNYVKFAPSYALMMRAMQLASLITAMVGRPLYSSQQNSTDASLTLMFFAIVMATAPLFTYLRGYATCSFEPLTIISAPRAPCASCGRAFILFQRHSAPSSAMGGSHAQAYLFYGWAVIFGTGLLGAYLLYQHTVNSWRKIFQHSPLYVAVMELFNSSLSESLTVAEMEEVVVDSKRKGELRAAGYDDHGRLYSSAAVQAGLTEARAKALMQEAQNAASVSRLAVLVAKFEDSIIAERLHPDFILKRSAWKHNLLNADNLLRTSSEDMNLFDGAEAEMRSAVTHELQMNARAEVVILCCKELQKALLPASHLHYSEKQEMERIFSRKRIPSDAVSTILEYLVDIKSNSRHIMPIVDNYLDSCSTFVFPHEDVVASKLFDRARAPSNEIMSKFGITEISDIPDVYKFLNILLPPQAVTNEETVTRDSLPPMYDDGNKNTLDMIDLV